jgi:hypothetical protein
MRLLSVGAASVVLATGIALSSGVMGAGATTSEPPPTVTLSPHSKDVRVGHLVTFKAAAKDAVFALWQISTDGGQTWTSYSGSTESSRNSKLRTTYSLGPATVSENGWEIRVAFVNDPTGVPSGIQTSGSAVATLTVKGQ